MTRSTTTSTIAGRSPRRRFALGAAALLTAAAGVSATAISTGAGAAGDGIDAERCETNRAAGTITYLSSFDFAAAASIVDVVVAKESGYYEALCLDVELRPGFSTSNYPLIASDTAQFSSAGNWTEVLNYSTDGSEFVVLTAYGKAPIEALVTPDGGATEIAALEGATIGVKGDLPPSIVALLASHGLARGEGYEELLLDGYDPISQLASGIDALPVYKSNEPGQLEAAGVPFNIFDPADDGIPGTFGLIYTSREFAEANPTVVEDFVRATLKGMEDAVADPEAAVAMAVEQIDAAGNQAYLTLEGETFRWQQEMAVMLESTPEGDPVGLVDPELFRAEYDAYVEAGVWPDGAPDFVEAFDPGPAAAAYDADGNVIWP